MSATKKTNIFLSNQIDEGTETLYSDKNFGTTAFLGTVEASTLKNKAEQENRVNRLVEVYQLSLFQIIYLNRSENKKKKLQN